MNVRRASPSPSSSVDSTTFRRRSSSIGKKKGKIVKSKEDVQVFTSLPPKVEGEIKYYLKLQITKINLSQLFIQQNDQTIINNNNNANKNSKNIKSAKPVNANINNEQILARCVWWGEESNGSLFRPKILNYNDLNKNSAQTTAKYVVRSGSKQFSAYLNDMKTLDIFLIRESNMEIVGKVQLYEIGELTDSNPIKGFFPAFNSSQTKIADVYVSIKLESPLNDSIDSKSATNDQGRPITPTSMANINDFYNKYQKFEQKQQLQFQLTDQPYNNKHLNSFKSDSYITNQSNNNNENIDLMKNHPIIDNLIERANKLKNEMSKSTQNNINNNNNDPNISIYYNNDESFISMLNYKNNHEPELDILSKQNSFIDHSNATSNFLFNNNIKNNLDYTHEANLNDMSRLSDPLHDPELLSALLYTNTNNLSNTFNDQNVIENDIELNELLNPKHLKVIDFNSIYEEPIKLDKNNDKINFSKSVSSSSVFNNRNRSVSRSSISSNDDYDLKKSSNSTRVSFEIQSSDGESSSSNLNNELKCIDVLSQERLSLLDLVQIAKLKIEKMCLFNLTNVSNLMERINNLEQFFNKSSSLNKSRSTTNLDPSFSKPPKAIKKQDTGQLFFIEYQFPVLASSRDNNINFQPNKSASQLATQVMRANSKNFRKQDENLINSEDIITYEHNADYSILFNPQLLESWWRSTIIFKIYARSPNLLNSSTNLTSLNNNKITMPYLIGVARLNLRNLLKSRNFKLYKKLAVIDQLTELEYNTYPNLVNSSMNNKNKRIGTLHVKIELLSDLKEFNTTLIKLNKKSNSLKLINGKKTSSTSSLLNNNKTINNKTSLSKLEQPSEQSIKSNNIINKQNQIVSYDEEKDEKFSIPIQMYLSINDGRGFKINNNLNNTSIYLICRLFWTREKVKFETTNTSNLFCWTLNLSFMLKHSLLNKNMKNNYMILEAWQKKTISTTSTNNDSLLGTIKLPLHEFYLRFNDETFLRSFLAQSQSQPLIGVDGWISVCDPFTGQKTGEINVLLAMGSNQQILNLTKILYDKSSFYSNNIQQNSSPSSSSSLTSNLIEHIFTFKVENIKVHPIKTILNDTMTFDESNCFINYTFPTTINTNNNDKTQNDIKFVFNTYSIASKTNQNYYNKLEHRLILKKTTSLYDELINKFINYFYGTSSYDQSSINSSDCFILFQVWSKSHYPNQREKLIANGQLPIDKLISVVNNSTINLNNRTFIVPLTNPNDNILNNNNNNNDRFVGQLHLTIEYRTDLLNYTFKNNIAQIEYNNNNNIQDSNVCLNIGILRATGLQAAISHAICRHNLRSTFNVDQSKVYIKFSLSFLSRPNDNRQSKLISTTVNGYSPEFFDYFDIACPLTSTYDQINNRKVSLAEQLECGKIIFELWYRNENNTNHTSDTLLGTCIVPLESLLDTDRMGIRGWLPIKSTNFMDTCLLEQIVNDSENNKQIGGLELSIRFTKNDDIDRIVEAATEIGWTKPNEIFSKSNGSISNNNKRQDQYLSHHHHLQQQKGSVKCLIEIEKAVHLPNMYDQKTKKHHPPNPFISFNISIDDPSQIAQTNIVESQSSPIWNYQLLVHIDKEFFLDEQKYFIMKVCHAIEPSSSSESNQFNSKCIGLASIDLTPLICGLTHISGWYNIQDSIGNCHGQLKINILPQENLFALKELYLIRKNKIQGNNSRISNTKQLDHHISNSSLNSYYNQPSSIEYMITTTNNNLNTYDFSKTTHSNSTLSSNNSNSSSYLKEIINDSQDLKSGLFQKLNELDELNRALKEKLEKKNTNQRFSFYNNNNNNYNNLKKGKDHIEKETNHIQNDNLIQLNATQQEIIKIVNNNNNNNKNLSTNIELENKNRNDKEILLENINETAKHQNEQPQTVFDSFWLNNSDGFNLQMQVKEKLSQIEEFVKNCEEEFKNELPIPPHQPQVILHKQNSVDNINITENLSNLNDTEYDQTFNLNASYEIVPNKNSEYIKIASNESVDKIIDCSKLDSIDEINNNNNYYYGEENEEELLKMVNEEDEEVNKNESIIEENNQYMNEQEGHQEEENLTVIVPEELNKIDEMVNETEKIELNKQVEDMATITSNITTTATTTIRKTIENKPNKYDINLSEKIKEINSKIPNYFLPKEDLEKTMRKLHYNYTEISKKEKLLSNEDLQEDHNRNLNEEQSKLKSTDLLNKNKNLLKQDFNRINKIFHSKFN